MKKILAMLLALVMIISLTACGAPAADPTEAPANDTTPVETPTDAPAGPTDPLEKLTAGRYGYKYTAEGHGDYAYYFHFYKEVPVLGSVFYAGFSNNKQNFVGTYTVEEKEYNYACYVDRADQLADETEDNSMKTKGTAPYTITFYDWDGNFLGNCGFDGDILYNDMHPEVQAVYDIYAQGASPVYYHYDADPESCALANTYAGELGVPYLSYEGDEDKTSTLEIYHNGTYADLVGAMIEGNWILAETAEGLEFTLTPFDSSETGAKVAVSADKKTCTYTPDGGDAIAMTAIGAGVELAYEFTGKYHIEAYGLDADAILSLYSDGNAVLKLNVAGNEQEMGKGTYTLEGYTFNIALDGCEAAASDVDATGTMTVKLAVPGTKLGDLELDMTLTYKGAPKEPSKLYEFKGTATIASKGVDVDVILTVMDDNSCTVIASAFGQTMDLAKGTYVLDGYTFNFDFEDAEDAASNVDGTGTMTVQFKASGTAIGDVDTTLTLVK